MGDCKRVAVIVDSSSAAADQSPSKKRKPTLEASFPPTILRQPISDFQSFKVLHNSTNSRSGDNSPPSSCCSSNDAVFFSSPLLDLEVKSCETVYTTTPSANNEFREMTPSSELCLENSDEMDSQPPSALSKSPPSDEIEDFFATAEKYEQKRFAEKYNFDIANDTPFEGRYQWVRLKP